MVKAQMRHDSHVTHKEERPDTRREQCRQSLKRGIAVAARVGQTCLP
jgi:transcriptional/translational regulatory protein YebC/TACO1